MVFKEYAAEIRGEGKQLEDLFEYTAVGPFLRDSLKWQC